MDLGHLLAPSLAPRVADQLAAIERRLYAVTSAPGGLVQRSSRHLLAAGGKRFRPLVVVLAASAIDPATDPRPVRDAAVSVELLHLSTLYHDDVIDAAATRRGVASVNARWGDRLAVMAGNRLTALSLEAAADVGDEVPSLLARTYASLVAGERLEARLAGRLETGIPAYLEAIDGKTASLVAAAARAGAAAAAATPATRDAAEAWGRTIGLAYQVADDVLDLTGTAAQAGKPVGNDLALGVYTWPLLDALTTSAGGALRRLLDGPLPHDPAVVNRAVAIVRACGSLDRATALVKHLLVRADGHLAELPAGAASRALRELGRTLVPDVEMAPAATAVPSRPVQAVGV
ncbi:MAG TPA: polyprenyl synthetase family protein [Egicoccus sp.]|nr:polyprenyl synthetase family protein [Egicoccus sp.]HSK24876.1 polyprenyl synthetase family protein [Egicoccus sp.]